MKFLCIRNYFIGSDTKPRWTKGKQYQGREPSHLEMIHGIAFYIESNEDIEYFVKRKDFPTYFKSIEDIREEKLSMLGL